MKNFFDAFIAKALEWERHQKQHSYLLIGEELQQAQSWLNNFSRSLFPAGGSTSVTPFHSSGKTR